jgi:ATP-dependent Lhr-like helicase
VLVATASLELGIDIGSIDLVCQIGSPHTIAALIQRVGRSGHRVGGLPKGGCFPRRATICWNAWRSSGR